MRAIAACRTALAALSLVAAAASAGQDWPAKPITVVVPYPPGGPTDIVARVVAQGLGDELKQTIIIDNRSGAGGNIGADMVAKAAPDGYTLLLATTAHAINMSLFKNLNYDTRKSFAPVSLLTSGPLVIVTRPDLPASNVRELIELAKSTPGKLTFASSGNGQSTHLAAELFGAMAGVRMVHVPYRGSAPAGQAFAAGQVELNLSLVTESLNAMKTPGVKPIAMAAAKRAREFPNVPTFPELGYENVQVYALNGLMVPTGTPRDIINSISREANAGQIGRAHV